MKVNILVKTYTLDDGRDTRSNAAKWMQDTLAKYDEKDVFSTHFTEDDHSTTAWIIIRKDKTATKDIS